MWKCVSVCVCEIVRAVLCCTHRFVCDHRGLRITDTFLSEPLSCGLRESVLRYDDISFSLSLPLSPPFSHSISALSPFQNLPLSGLLISHTVPLLQGHAAWPLLVRGRARHAPALTCQRRWHFTMRRGVRDESVLLLWAWRKRRKRRRWRRSRSTGRGGWL